MARGNTVPGFHSHDDDFLYESQRAPNFIAGKPARHKRSRTRSVSVTEWNSLHDTIRTQEMEIDRLQEIIATVNQLLKTARDLEKK